MTSESLWNQYSALFRRLYIDENKTLQQVKTEAEELYGFPSNSLSAYETKLRESLRLRKNLTPEGWLAIGQRIRSNEYRQWEVYIHGRKVTKKKVMKEVGRYAKREPSSKNLPMPPGARIEWTDLSLSRVADRSIGGQHPQQAMLPTLSDPTLCASVITDMRDEDLEMVDYQSMVSVKSPNEVVHGMMFLLYNREGIVDKTIDIALAARNRYSIHSCGAIFDPRLREMWVPMLNNIPFFSLNHTLDRIFHENLAPSLRTGLLPISQISHMRNVGIAQPVCSSHGTNLGGISDIGDTADNADHVHGLPTNGTVSTGFDPLKILGQLVYYLSNHFAGLEKVEETMRFLIEKAPLNFVHDFIRSDSHAIRESWIGLAEWSFELGNKEFFERIMRVSLSCNEWVQFHGARCLTLAANLGCTKVARTIIECGVSPDKFSHFRVSPGDRDAGPGFSRLAASQYERMNRSPTRTDTVTSCPLLEAAVKGRHDILEILKDAHADGQLRLDGLTICGHTLCAHQYGLIEKGDLLVTLRLLISMGENVDAPMYQNEKTDRFDRDEDTVGWSDETLLDAIYVTTGNSVLFQEAREQSQVPHGVLTVSGILKSAEDGQDSLHHYMETARYPSGIPRKRIKEIALVRCLKFPKAFKSMMGIGLSLETNTLRMRRQSLFKDWSAGRPLYDDLHNRDGDHYFLRRLDTFPESISQYIVDHLVEHELSFRLNQVGCSTIKALVPRLSIGLVQRFGTDLLWKAIAFDDPDATEACLKAIGNPQEFDILKLVGSWKTGHQTFKVLHDYGTRVTGSPHGSKSWRFGEFSTKMLQWLMVHLSDLNGRQCWEIVLHFLVTEVDWIDPTAFEQWVAGIDRYKLFGWGHCHEFSSEEAETYKDSTSAFLALEICLESSMKLIKNLFLEKGLDLNSKQVPAPSNSNPEINEENWGLNSNFNWEFNWKLKWALKTAVHKRDVSAVQTLLDSGVDINHCDAKGQTALELAVKSHVEQYKKDRNSEETNVSKRIVIGLLENGADPNFEHYKIFKTTASPSLVLAVQSENPDLHLIQLLLEKGANANTNVSEHGSALLKSMLEDKKKNLQLKKEIYALLVAGGAKHNKVDELRSACADGDIGLARFHLDNGADPNGGWSGSLQVSARNGNIPLALILLAAGATLSGKDDSLVGAAARGRLDMVSLLLPHEKRLEEVERALKHAIRGRFYSIVQLLRQAKANWKA